MITTQPHFETLEDYLKYADNGVGELPRDRASNTKDYRDYTVSQILTGSSVE